MKQQNKNSIFKYSVCLSGEQLLLYTKNQLTPEEKRKAELHLVDCELCSDTLEGFELLSNGNILDETKTQVRLLTSNTQGKQSFGSIKWWLAAASLIFIIGITLWSYHKAYQPNSRNLFQAERMPAEIKEKAVPLQEPVNQVSGANRTLDHSNDKNAQYPKPEHESNRSSIIHTPPVVEDKENVASIEVEGIADEMTIMEENSSKRTANNNIENKDVEPIDPVAISGTTAFKNKASRVEPNVQTSRAEIRYLEGYKTLASGGDNSIADSLLLTDRVGVEAKYENEEAKKADLSIGSGDINSIAYNALLENAIHFYKMQEYKKALDLFSQILHTRKEDQNALFYGALCYDALKQYAAAKKNLTHIIKREDSTFYEESKWNLALIYLKQNKIREGRILLQEIKDHNGFYSTKASEKLQEIN